MNTEEFVKRLESEMEDAEDSIYELEGIIASAEADIAFIKGRRCLACSLLAHMSGDYL